MEMRPPPSAPAYAASAADARSPGGGATHAAEAPGALTSAEGCPRRLPRWVAGGTCTSDAASLNVQQEARQQT